MPKKKVKDERPKLMIYPSWADMLVAAPPEYCHKLFTAMWRYKNGATYDELELDPITAGFFAGIKAQFDLDIQNYAETKAKNQENGKRHVSSQAEPNDAQMNPDSGTNEPKTAAMNPDVAAGSANDSEVHNDDVCSTFDQNGTQMNPVGSVGIPNEPKATQWGGVKDKDKDKDKVKDLDKDVINTPLTPLAGGTAAAAADDSADGEQMTVDVDSTDPADIPASDSPPAEVGQTAKPKRQRKSSSLSKTDQERFDRWYATYPRKVGKEAAIRAWAKLRPDDELTDTMIQAVSEQKIKDFRFRDRQFIPYPAKWLNGGEWENEYPDENAGSGFASGRIRHTDWNDPSVMDNWEDTYIPGAALGRAWNADAIATEQDVYGT